MKHILAVHIPRKACETCRKLGYQWYDSADTTQYDKIYLQDRCGDVIKEKTEPS
jgi:hypothetical protein